MENQQYPQRTTAFPCEVGQSYSELARAYLSKVYSWMAGSLAITAGVAVYTANDIQAIAWAQSHIILLLIAIVAIILIMHFAARRLTAGALGILLLTFSAAEGVLFGPILTIYTTQSLGLTFACTAGMFGAMALYGAFTKRDLTKMRSFLFMGLIGLIIAGIANLFFGNGPLDLIISGAGVVIFCLFTAFDTQKILAEGGTLSDHETRSKGAIFGALTLYLDFINLFLYLLRFLGKVNDN